MSYQKNLDELGNTIEAIIDRAVSSQDFQQLNQTIRQALNTAVDTGGDAVRRAMDEAAKKKAARNRIVEERSDAPQYVPPYRTRKRTGTIYQANVNIYSSTLGSSRKPQQQGPKLPALYQNPSGKLAGGICKTVGGGVLTLFGSGGLISSSVVALVTSLGSVFSVLGTISLLGLGGGIWLLTNGIQSIKKVGRYEKYLKALGNKTYCELNRLAQAVGKSPKFVRKELKGMIDDGLFLEGHLDEEETGLITSNDSYVHYLETKQKQAVKERRRFWERYGPRRRRTPERSAPRPRRCWIGAMNSSASFAGATTPFPARRFPKRFPEWKPWWAIFLTGWKATPRWCRS